MRKAAAFISDITESAAARAGAAAGARSDAVAAPQLQPTCKSVARSLTHKYARPRTRR